MGRRQQLTEAQIAALYDPPTDARDLARHYTLSPEDLASIARRRGDQNRLGHALMLLYLRHPGRPLRAGERPPAALVAFVAKGVGAAPHWRELRGGRRRGGAWTAPDGLAAAPGRG